MATELFNVKEKGVLNKAHQFISQNKKSSIKAEFGFTISQFPNSWEAYDSLMMDWRKTINFMVQIAPQPMLKFLVAVNIPRIIFADRPVSFNWSQYEHPEILLDCSPISTWVNGYSIKDPKMETIYLDLIVAKKIFYKNLELRESLADVHLQFDDRNPQAESANYFVPLGNIIQLKFELE